MLTVTVNKIMSWKPCPEYTRKRVKELFAGRERVSALDILDMDIYAEDKLWAVLRSDLIPEPDLWELACRFAESALRRKRKIGQEPDKRSWEAIKARRKWLKGKITDGELALACRAACLEIYDPAAFAAACAAGYFGVDVAVDEAAFEAAQFMAYPAIRKRQVAMVKRYLGKREVG